jgi:hypothetical protein
LKLKKKKMEKWVEVPREQRDIYVYKNKAKERLKEKNQKRV